MTSALALPRCFVRLLPIVLSIRAVPDAIRRHQLMGVRFCTDRANREGSPKISSVIA
jgi:hypothetical protein